MKKHLKLFIILALAVAGVIGLGVSESVWADNTGGDQHDSTAGDGSSTNGGGSCPNNSCGSVVYSGSTAIVSVPVTEQTRTEGIHVPSVCTNSGCSSFNYTPSESTIYTGDAALGSTYYMAAMIADADGVVYIDGQPRTFHRGEVITYIPFESNGTNGLSSLWSISNSRRNDQYGSISFNDAMTLYHQMLAHLNRELSLTELKAFGGELRDAGLTEQEICNLGLCGGDPGDPSNPPGGTPPIGSCHVGSHAGWTEGRIMVNNYTKGTGWTGEVWARPGDTVRFSMYYCWGVGAVGGSADNNPASPWAIYPGGNAIPYGSSVNQVWFDVSASPSNNYLFGYDENVIRDTGTRHVLIDPHQSSIGGAAPELASIDGDSATNDYNFLYYSPSVRGEDADNHNCSIFDFAGFTIGGSHGYQIPGATAGGCNASGKSGNMSDAGSSFSQTITYSYDTAWQRYRHNEMGFCNGTCTWQDENPAPGVDGHEVYQDRDMNTLIEYNSNVAAAPYQSLQEALSAGVNDWGLIKKWSNDTATHGNSALGDCDYSGCSANNWSSWPYWPNDCGCASSHMEPCHCVNQSQDEAPDCECEHCDDWVPGPCWGSFDAGKEQHSSNKPGKSHYKPDKDYSTGQQQLGVSSSTATVNVPYSYRTATTSTIQEGDVIYLGETVFSAFTASITPRIVSEVRAGEAYATVVPGYIQAVEFVVDKNSSLNPSTGTSNAGGTDPCSYYSGLGMISGCNTIWEEHGEGGMLNGEGRYGGKTYSTSVNRVVPDIYPVGSKYCVAVGISTSDSHSQPDSQVVSGMSNPSGWRISNLSCRTIAKKPNFQVWNGGFYTKGGIKSSTTIKRVNANLGDPIDPTGYFGSWEEYYISAKGNVSGMSSAAGLGYYGGYNNRVLGLQGGSSLGKTYCELSRMTIANSSCASENSGKYYAGNSLIEDSVATVLERIRSRYLSSTHGIIQLENGATYIYPEQGSIRTSELANIAHGALSNTELSSSVIRQTKGSINSASEQTTRNYASNTLIIHVDGTLTIDSDICTGTGTCGYDTNLALGYRNADYYDNIYSLPQILIIADGGIIISDNVTQIDAWLITNGNINTCNGWTQGTTSFSADSCSRQLIVNGPVFANSLTPVRNSGADGGTGIGNSGGDPIYYNLTDDGSIQPGEIFNLRPDVLYWAYSQAQRFSQANVTYTRELAPRY